MLPLTVRYAALVVVVIALNFLLPRLLPGDPFDSLSDASGAQAPALSAAARSQLRATYHLDQPLGAQFLSYLSDVAHGDLGWSMSRNQPVSQLIVERAPWTVGLLLWSVLVTSIAGTLLGIVAVWRGGRLTAFALGCATAVAGMPEFLVAIGLLLLLAVGAGWFPLYGARSAFGEAIDIVDIAWHLALPALTLVLVGTAAFALLARGVLGSVRNSAFLDTARGKGLGELRVALAHALPNALPPLLAFLGVRVAHVLGGALVIERVFALPGLGLLAFEAIRARDYPVLQTVFLIGSLAVLAVNFLVDCVLARLPGRNTAIGKPASGQSGSLVGVGVLILAAATLAALLAPWLAPYDPRAIAGPPLSPPATAHPLGTNDLGQDQLSVLLFGARSSLVTAVLVALVATVLAWSVGLAIGFGGRRFWPLRALTDVVLALPALPLYLLVVALVGPSQAALVGVLGLLVWPAFARIVRAQVLVVRTAPHVEAARAIGASPLRVGMRHVLPSTVSLLPATLMLTVRYALLAEATLAFLGLGDPSTKSWGTSLSWAFADPLIFASGAWTWWVLPPAIAIVLVVLATTLVASTFDGQHRRKAPQELAQLAEARPPARLLRQHSLRWGPRHHAIK